MIEEKTKLIRGGFWHGIGLIIPFTLGVFFIGLVLTLVEKYSYPGGEFKHNVEQLVIENFRDVKQGDQVYITGSIVNKGTEPVESILLEAEFFNGKGEFVFEESEYIKKTLAPNERENFQIKCGCTDKSYPEYKKVTVRVMSASNG